jgi:hypothetical protein
MQSLRKGDNDDLTFCKHSWEIYDFVCGRGEGEERDLKIDLVWASIKATNENCTTEYRKKTVLLTIGFVFCVHSHGCKNSWEIYDFVPRRYCRGERKEI